MYSIGLQTDSSLNYHNNNNNPFIRVLYKVQVRPSKRCDVACVMLQNWQNYIASWGLPVLQQRLRNPLVLWICNEYFLSQRKTCIPQTVLPCLARTWMLGRRKAYINPSLCLGGFQKTVKSYCHINESDDSTHQDHKHSYHCHIVSNRRVMTAQIWEGY